jgi:hypothetical protein
VGKISRMFRKQKAAGGKSTTTPDLVTRFEGVQITVIMHLERKDNGQSMGNVPVGGKEGQPLFLPAGVLDEFEKVVRNASETFTRQFMESQAKARAGGQQGPEMPLGALGETPAPRPPTGPGSA